MFSFRLDVVDVNITSFYTVFNRVACVISGIFFVKAIIGTNSMIFISARSRILANISCNERQIRPTKTSELITKYRATLDEGKK